MATEIARYACTYIPNMNDTNNIKPDSSGYYPCVLGGFNMQNHSGIYYPMDGAVEDMFKPTGIVGRKLSNGLLTGEYSHPNIENLDFNGTMKRLAKIDELLESHHFRAVSLQRAKDEYNKPIILCLGELRPQGPYGQHLKDKLDNPHQNVAFSIRSFTIPTVYNGMASRLVRDIVTWDFVGEPGIKKSTQFNTANSGFTNGMGLENLVDEIPFTNENIQAAMRTNLSLGLESNNSYLTHVRTSLGWREIEVVSPVFKWK